MREWTNTAQSPSNLDSRTDHAWLYVMDKLNIPECGLKRLRATSNDDSPRPLLMHMTTDYGEAGLWKFHPIMQMSYKKKGHDYTQTTVLKEGLTATGVYVPITCGKKQVDVVWWPKCGNLSVVKKMKHNYYEGKWHKCHDWDVTEFNKVPIPETASLLCLGLLFFLLVKRFKR